MRAVGYYQSLPIDDEEALVDIELPQPEPGPRDLCVSVRAVSVNPVDTKTRMRQHQEDGTATVLGYDAAGVVDAIGSEVTLFQPGDEVYYAGAINRPGTDSEYHLVDERIVGRKPKSVSFSEAAALPLTSITAWELLFDRLGVPYANFSIPATLLVINGAGGVGSMLIQLARRLTGLIVVASASRPETIAWCKEMGAHHVVDHHQPLDQVVRDIGIQQVEYVAGLSNTDKHLPAIVELIAPQGKLALIDDPKELDILKLKRKCASVHLEFMFTRSLYETADMIEQHILLDQVADLVDSGVLRTTMTQDLGTINAAHLKKAHAIAERGSAIGKIVLNGF